MRKIFIALCTMVSVITGNAQNTPIGENIELAGRKSEQQTGSESIKYIS